MGTIFCGDVVLDSVNLAYRDEDNISDQLYDKQIFSGFCHEDFKFLEENAYINKYSTLQEGIYNIGF